MMASRPLTGIEQTINELAQRQFLESAFGGSPIGAPQSVATGGQSVFGSGVQPASTMVDIPQFSQAGVQQNAVANFPQQGGAPAQPGGAAGVLGLANQALRLPGARSAIQTGIGAVGGGFGPGAGARGFGAGAAAAAGSSAPALASGAGFGAGPAAGAFGAPAAAGIAGVGGPVAGSALLGAGLGVGAVAAGGLAFKGLFNSPLFKTLFRGGPNAQRATFGATEDGFGVTDAPRIAPGSAADAVAQGFGNFVGRALTAAGADPGAVEGTISLDGGQVKIHDGAGELVSTHDDPIAGIEAFAKQQGVTDRDFSQLQLPDFGGQFEARVGELEGELRAQFPGQPEELFAGDLQALRGGSSLFDPSFNQQSRILEGGEGGAAP